MNNKLTGIVLLTLLVISVASCAPRRGYDRPSNPRPRTGWHRGQGYGHGAGYYNAPRNYRK